MMDRVHSKVGKLLAQSALLFVIVIVSRPTERPPSLYSSPFVHFQSTIASIVHGSQVDSLALTGLLESKVVLNSELDVGF